MCCVLSLRSTERLDAINQAQMILLKQTAGQTAAWVAKQSVIFFTVHQLDKWHKIAQIVLGILNKQPHLNNV